MHFFLPRNYSVSLVPMAALVELISALLFDDYITRTYDLAKEFAAVIKETHEFQLALDPASNIVCFRYLSAAADSRQLNDMNTSVREKLKEEGEFYIVRTVINDVVYLRTTLMNPFTSRKELVQLLERIRSHFKCGSKVSRKDQ